MDNKAQKENILKIVISIFSFYCAICVWMDTSKPSYYAILPLVPFSYAIINLLSKGLYKDIFDISNNLAKLVIHCLYFIRQSLSIYLLYLGSYYSALNQLNTNNVSAAVVLMIVDTICVYVLLNTYTRLAIGEKKLFDNNLGSKKKKNYGGIVSFLTVFMIVFCIGAYSISPLIRNSYAAIWDLSTSVDNYYQMRLNTQAGSFERVLFTLFTQILDFARIFVPCWIIYNLRKSLGQKVICIIIGFSLCILQFTMILNENVYILISVLIIILFMIKVFPKYRKAIIWVSAVSGIIVIVIYYFMVASVVVSSKTGFESASGMFQEYFPGIANIACGFNVHDNNKWNTLFFDIYETIPYHNTLFGLEGERLGDLYNLDNNVKYKIVPCLIQSYHYINFLAPVVSCLFVSAALKCQKKAKNAGDMFSYCSYILLLIFSAMTPICYYPTIFFSRYFGTIIPMKIISWLSGRKYSLSFDEGN